MYCHKRNRQLFLTLAGFCCFVAFAQSAAANDADAALLRQAEARREAGDLAAALELYDDLFSRYPENNILKLGRARSYFALGRYEEAANIYSELLEKFPNQIELRREAARSQWRLGNDQLADQLLQAPDSLDVTQSGIANFLSPATPRPSRDLTKAEAKKEGLQISGRFQTGLIYDSNVNSGPASDILSLGQTIVVYPGVDAMAAAAFYAGGTVGLVNNLDENGIWALVADGTLMFRANANADLIDSGTMEWQWGKVSAGLRYVCGDNYFEGRLRSEIFDYEFSNNVMAVGADFNYTRRLADSLQLISQAGVEWRFYNRNNPRDGTYGGLGQFLRVFWDDQRHSLTLGGKYAWGDAEQKSYSYNGWEVGARLDLNLTKKIQLAPHISFTQERYRGPATNLETKKRRDNRLRTGADMTYRVGDAWNLEAGYQYVRNYSTSALYDYGQHVVNTGVSRNF